MKAIHNGEATNSFISFVGNYKLKYNFESNSQPVAGGDAFKPVGNYKLKYNFESNSQPKTSYTSLFSCWEL